MLVDEAKEHKENEFNKVQKKIYDFINECESMYTFLSKYNDLITYEELYDLTEEDKECFIKIRDKSHDIEHLLLHCREDLIGLIEGDIEWFLTDEESRSNKNYFDDISSSDVFFNCFRVEIYLSLIFDKLKQLNIPRKVESKLYVHQGGGCC